MVDTLPITLAWGALPREVGGTWVLWRRLGASSDADRVMAPPDAAKAAALRLSDTLWLRWSLVGPPAIIEPVRRCL